CVAPTPTTVPEGGIPSVGLPVTTGGGGVACPPTATVWVTVTVEAVPMTVVGWPPPRLTQRKLIEVPWPGLRPIRRWSSASWTLVTLTLWPVTPAPARWPSRRSFG